MTPIRAVAALAAIITALLLQATLLAPLAINASYSLPAVLVAAVAVESGAGTGMALGFAAGLIADLGSAHPAGALALVWLGLGTCCGLVADARRVLRGQWLIVTLACAVASTLATLLLTAVGAAGATAAGAVRGLPVSLLGDVVLAAAMVPIVRRFLRSAILRAPAAGHG